MSVKQERGNSHSGVKVSTGGVRVYRKVFAKNRRYQFYNEYLCSRYLQTLGSNITPQVISINHANQYIDYELCESVEDDKNSNLDYLELTKRVHAIASHKQGLGIELWASEPLLNLRDFLSQLGARIKRLAALSSEEDKVIISRCGLLDLYENKYKQLEESLLDICLVSMPIFSHADSGVHNCVRGKNGALLMADLEYAGKDSPLKQSIDYLLHPKCQRCTDTHESWWRYFDEEVFDVADHRVKRLVASALSLKWSIIMMNEYRPEIWMLRVSADESRANKRSEILNRQMEKAFLYYRICDRIEKSEVPYGLFSQSERNFISESY